MTNPGTVSRERLKIGKVSLAAMHGTGATTHTGAPMQEIVAHKLAEAEVLAKMIRRGNACLTKLAGKLTIASMHRTTVTTRSGTWMLVNAAPKPVGCVGNRPACIICLSVFVCVCV